MITTILTVLFLGLGIGAGIFLAIIFTLWYLENRN